MCAYPRGTGASVAARNETGMTEAATGSVTSDSGDSVGTIMER